MARGDGRDGAGVRLRVKKTVAPLPDMSKELRLFTSESVSEGHPDKVCDQISDAVLDAILAQDPDSRVACETMVSRGFAVLAGEITTKAYVDFQETARQVIKEIGYDDPEVGFDSNSCAVLTSIQAQSADIALGVDETTSQSKEQGAGDQGMMFGYACKETAGAHAAADRASAHKHDAASWPTPRSTRGRTRARSCGRTARARSPSSTTTSGNPHAGGHRGHLAPAHRRRVRTTTSQGAHPRGRCIEDDSVPANMLDGDTRWYLNPTGRFVEGGPKADSPA